MKPESTTMVQATTPTYSQFCWEICIHFMDKTTFMSSPSNKNDDRDFVNCTEPAKHFIRSGSPGFHAFTGYEYTAAF